MPNMALAHVLGATVQTALLNTPLVVFIGWGLGVPMDLNFKQFEAIVLILAILVMGNFLRDGKSNYLEGILAVFIYVSIVCSDCVEEDQDMHIVTELLLTSSRSSSQSAPGIIRIPRKNPSVAPKAVERVVQQSMLLAFSFALLEYE